MFEPKVIVKGIKVPGLVELVTGPEPLWGDGTGRNSMDGHYSGTFIGYFTTLELKFGIVTDAEYNQIKSLLEHPFIENVQFTLEKDMNEYKQGDLFTEDFYNGQAIKSSPKQCGNAWSEFSVVLTAIDRRPQLT
ncbi:MAG: hypothetical protein HFJ52_00105 [Clostridia bacterium]|nr:hypothetical protein [Clostridia bacterium]